MSEDEHKLQADLDWCADRLVMIVGERSGYSDQWEEWRDAFAMALKYPGDQSAVTYAEETLKKITE